eukprot:2983802-Karenia_brevis.AAC.1
MSTIVDSDDEDQRTEASQEQRLIPEPPGPPPEWRCNIEEDVRSDVDFHNRQNLWKKAVDNCIRGKYSQADFYLLTHFLCGTNGTFVGRDWRKRQ